MDFIEPNSLLLGSSMLAFSVMTLRRIHLEELEEAKAALLVKRAKPRRSLVCGQNNVSVASQTPGVK